MIRKPIHTFPSWVGPGFVAVCDDGAVFSYEFRTPTEAEFALAHMNEPVRVPYVWRELPPIPGTLRASQADAPMSYEPPEEQTP